MPRRPRLSTGGIAYHVLNRRVGRLELFEAFQKIFAEAHHRTSIRIAAYCLMPNHFGSEDWIFEISKQLGLDATLHSRVVRNESESKRLPTPFYCPRIRLEWTLPCMQHLRILVSPKEIQIGIFVNRNG
jgi:hypothetical protein